MIDVRAVDIFLKGFASNQNFFIRRDKFIVIDLNKLVDYAISICLFSRFKKYFGFFSPSLYHMHLDLKIAPFVLCSIICSSFLFFSSNSLG